MPTSDVSNCRAEILRLFASYVHLTSFHLRHLTDRPQKPIERDLRWLRENGFIVFKPHPIEKFGPYVWYLTQKGWDWCFGEKLFAKKVQATDQKGDNYLKHDLVLTDLHVKLFDIFGDDLYWTQLRQHCYRRFGKDTNDRVNMDAFASFPVGNEFAVFCVEVEKSKDSVKLGESSRMLKVDAYEAYARGPFQEEYGEGADLRVLWTFGSEQKTLNFAAKLQEERATRRHWSLDENVIPTLTKELPVFITPKEIILEPTRRRFTAQRRYSLAEA